ncbi:MAG: DinB family protein [Anaerolineales bacterium]|jgi:hypothetical protein
MSIKEQLLDILEQGRQTELDFLENLSQDERNKEGTFEQWSAKDLLAHTSFWQKFNTERAAAWIDGEDLDPAPDFNHENAQIYARNEDKSWEEIEAQAQGAHTASRAALESLTEEQLLGPSEGSETTPLWQDVLGNMYSHKLIHFSEYYQQRDKNKLAGQLWDIWAEKVSVLDQSPAWQGLVNYNAACGLALAGDPKGALGALKKSLEVRPSLISWSRLDDDLAILHATPEYRALFAAEYWWKALEANPQAESLADQFLRLFSTLRVAIDRIPDDEWRKGDSLYQRPASLTLHLLQSIDLFSALNRGESSGDPLYLVNWQERESSRLPDKQAILAYMKTCEERQANFLAAADFGAEETFFPFTGSTVLSRPLYNLRHAQHHFADLATEMTRRGLNPPDWQ